MVIIHYWIPYLSFHPSNILVYFYCLCALHTTDPPLVLPLYWRFSITMRQDGQSDGCKATIQFARTASFPCSPTPSIFYSMYFQRPQIFLVLKHFRNHSWSFYTDFKLLLIRKDQKIHAFFFFFFIVNVWLSTDSFYWIHSQDYSLLCFGIKISCWMWFLEGSELFFF